MKPRETEIMLDDVIHKLNLIIQLARKHLQTHQHSTDTKLLIDMLRYAELWKTVAMQRRDRVERQQRST